MASSSSLGDILDASLTTLLIDIVDNPAVPSRTREIAWKALIMIERADGDDGANPAPGQSGTAPG